MSTAVFTQRTRWLVALVLGLTVLASAFLWWQALRSQDQLRAQVLLQAEQRSLHLADAMAGQVSNLLTILDLELLALRREWNRDTEGFDEVVRSVLATLPNGFVSHVTVADADGRVVYSTVPMQSVIDISDRDHFKVFKDGDDRMFIGKPVRSQLIDGWTFAASRPVLSDGRFGGVLSLVISSDYMASRLAALRLSDDDIVALMHADGAFLARSQDNPAAMGKSVPADRPFLVDPGLPKGLFKVRGLLDEKPRTYGWQRLPDAGLVVAIGLADSSVLAPLTPAFEAARSAATVLSILLLVSGGLIATLIARVSRTQSAAAAGQALRTRLFDSSHVPMVVVDPVDARFIDCNPAAARIYGYRSRDEVLGKTPLDVSAPLQYDGQPTPRAARPHLTRAMTGEPEVFEWLHQRADGEQWDAEVHLMRFEAQGRQLLQFTLHDITGRKRTEAALRESEARLKEAQQLARIGSWQLDLVTHQLTWSDEIYRIFELDPATHTPSYKRFILAVHPDDRDEVSREYARSVEQRQPYDVVHRLLLPGGRVKHVRESGFTQFDGDRPLRSVGTVQDITEVREAQDALQRLNEELEQRVAERTRELSVLNRELEAFAYSVSHDLRTPLRSINGYAALLTEEFGAGLPPEARAHLERIRSSASRMGQLITDLLTLARLSQAELHRQPVDLSLMGRQIAGELAHSDPARVVRWQIEDGITIDADPVLMRVVMLNLLGNAWKYTGQVAEAQIALTHRVDAQGTVRCCVRDNGAGFDMKYASQLFEPFKRLHAHHEFEGTGVGLATVHRVIERHGGRVWGEGAVGQGATFCFSLPMRADAD